MLSASPQSASPQSASPQSASSQSLGRPDASAVPAAPANPAINDNSPSFFSRLCQWFEHAGAVNALHRLDDRTLADIGLKRTEIDSFVRRWSQRDDNAA